MRTHIPMHDTDSLSLLEQRELVDLLIQDLSEHPESSTMLEDLE